jgi:hypothetical protein
MAGERLIVTQRDRAVLADVSRFGVITREQLMRLNHFASKTRANERLKRLASAGYLATRSQPLLAGGPALVYGPGPALETSRMRRRRLTEASGLLVTHQLGLVDIQIAFDQHTRVERWLTADDLAVHALGLIPDAYLEYGVGARTYAAFVEYDRGTETLGRLEGKVRAYLDLACSGRVERAFRHRYFRALFITDTPGRLATLVETAGRLTDKVVRLTTRPHLTAHGPLASIWRRPGAERSESLIGS